MSIPVELSALGEALADRGPGYLLTASSEGQVKAVTVEPTLVDGVLLCGASRGSLRNLSTSSAATLLFPPPIERGYTLLIDGTGAGDEDGITVTPTSAVLHRPAHHADPCAEPADADGCGQDCRPVS